MSSSAETPPSTSPPHSGRAVRSASRCSRRRNGWTPGMWSPALVDAVSPGRGGRRRAGDDRTGSRVPAGHRPAARRGVRRGGADRREQRGAQAVRGAAAHPVGAMDAGDAGRGPLDGRAPRRRASERAGRAPAQGVRQPRVHPHLHRPFAGHAPAVVRDGVLRQQDQGGRLPRPQEDRARRRPADLPGPPPRRPRTALSDTALFDRRRAEVAEAGVERRPEVGRVARGHHDRHASRTPAGSAAAVRSTGRAGDTRPLVRRARMPRTGCSCHWLKGTPAGGTGSPDAIAHTVVRPAGDEAAFAHGTVVDADGGRRGRRPDGRRGHRRPARQGPGASRAHRAVRLTPS